MANPNLSPLEVSDFSGGITDKYLSARSNQCERADNFLITENKKIITRLGSEISDLTNSQLPSGAFKHNGLIDFESTLLELSARNIYYKSAGAWVTLQGPSTNPALGSGTTSNYASWAEWNRHLFVTNDSFCKPSKVYKDAGGVLRVRTAGMPKLATSPTVTAGAAGANSYIYAFHYFYEYVIGSETFQDFGTTKLVALDAAAAPDASAVAISAIPVIANGATDNYDTGVIKVKIYRTQNAGTSFYLIGEVTNGTTIFTDNFSDASIVNNVILYTDSGALDNDPPPACKYIIVADNITLYLHVREGSSTYPNKFRPSIPNDGDSCPESFGETLDDEITGGGVVGQYPIIFCKKRIYRIEGKYDATGRGFIAKKEIDRIAGCVSHRSIVSVPGGLVFAGNDGFYFTNGFSVQKITQHLNQSYKNLANKDRIYGEYNPNDGRVYWAVQTSAGSADVDGFWVLDLRFGVSEESSFTTWSGTNEGFSPTAIKVFNNLLYRGDRRGYLFVHKDTLFTDPKVNAAAATSTWITQTIIYDFKSAAYNFGTDFPRKWSPAITVKAENVTNLSLAVNSYNDDSAIAKSLVELRFRGNLIWGTASLEWGDPDLVWNYDRLIEGRRRFPAGGLRCSYKQVQFTNSYTVIENSDTLGNCNVDSMAKTATLTTVGNVWPTDAVDYYISFVDDLYDTQFLITTRTDTVLTFTDTAGQSAAATGSKWLIKGYARGDVFNPVVFILPYQILTDTHPPYDGVTGGNT